MVKNPRGEIFSPRGFANPRGDFDLCSEIFSRSLQILREKTYRITSVGSILLEISHFSFLCQLKVLGHFAKNWFGKKIPVAVNIRIYEIYIKTDSVLLSLFMRTNGKHNNLYAHSAGPSSILHSFRAEYS